MTYGKLLFFSIIYNVIHVYHIEADRKRISLFRPKNKKYRKSNFISGRKIKENKKDPTFSAENEKYKIVIAPDSGIGLLHYTVFDGLSLPNDSNLSHAPHFALLALLSTSEKYSHMGFDFCDISLSILGLVDDSTKLYDTPYTGIYANENCISQLHNDSVVEQWLLDT